jgi:hypothetical protein
MSLRLARSAVMIAFVASVGLALPACKKKKPPAPAETPAPASPTTSPTLPNAGPTYGFNELPAPPRGPLFSATTEAPYRIGSESNVKQIAFAMHMFSNDHGGALPGGYADKTGKPGLSWRVALLPYLDQEPLFKAFKLDEPWDSPSNKKLIDKMPAIYAPPRQNLFGYSFYRGFTGPNAWLPERTGKPGELLFGVKITELRDGTSSTILVAEAAEAVIWTKPDEVQFTRGTTPKLGGVFISGFTAGMADGSARFIRKTVDGRSVANAIDINDGGIVDLDN